MSLFSKEDIHVGIAPIGWSNDDLPELGKENTFHQAISEMALAGFEGTEVGCAYPSDTTVLKTELNRRGLRIASKWFGSQLLVKSYEEVAEDFLKTLNYLNAVGADRVNVCDTSYSTFDHWEIPLYGESHVMDGREWDRMIMGLNKLGEISSRRGFKLCYHHHLGTSIESEEETDYLMKHTDEDTVFLCYDTGHFLAAKADPVKMLDKHANRIGHVHLKDYRKSVWEQILAEGKCFREGVLAGVFTVPGDGDFDFMPVFEILASHRYKGWLLVEAEQDPDKANPLDYARKTRAYIREKTGV